VDFRWVAFIALWSMLVGPIFDLAPGNGSRGNQTIAVSQPSAKRVATSPWPPSNVSAEARWPQ
jgi:hypothetical protein